MILSTINQHVHVIHMTFKWSLGQRSRSDSDGHRNIVSAIASEPLKGFEPKLNAYCVNTTTRTCLCVITNRTIAFGQRIRYRLYLRQRQTVQKCPMLLYLFIIPGGQ